MSDGSVLSRKLPHLTTIPLRGINRQFVWVHRLLEDLEEVQTDKVSMEYLLREKLERLVQSEIEARVARMHQVRTP